MEKFLRETGGLSLKIFGKRVSLVLALVLAFSMVLNGLAFAADNSGNKVERIAGKDRYVTAAEIAKKQFGTADTVVIARGDNDFADGLAASVLAGAKNAPILLTVPDRMLDSVKQALQDLKVKNAYIVGSEVAVSGKVQKAIEDLGIEVKRVGGKNRFETALNIAKEAGVNTDTAYIVNGTAFADAMVAGVAAFTGKGVILPVLENKVPDITNDAIKQLGIKKTVIVGSTAVVSAAVEKALKDAGVEVKRLGGSDRELTSVEFAKDQFGDVDGVTVVNGREGLADAVGAAVFGKPILYAYKDKTRNEVNDYVKNALSNNPNASVTIVGGETVVTNNVQNNLQQIVDEAQPKELKIESVSVINAKQIEVKFNKALDRNTVTVDNFAVTQTGDVAGSDRLTGAGATNAIGTTNTGSAVLSADGKTVILTLNNRAALTNPTTVTVTVSANVKDTSGKAIEATTKTASFTDSSVPVAEKVETVGSNQFRVIFSETVTTAADRAGGDTGTDAGLNARNAFVVDNNAVTVTSVDRDPQNPKALLVTVSGNLSAGNHTVRVNPAGNALIQDYAGYAVVQTDLTYNHVEDTNAPTFTAEARNERTVRLTFNKPVTIPPSNNIAIRHSYDAAGAVAVLADNTGGTITPVAGSNNTQYDVTFNTPLPTGQVPIYVSYVNNTGLTAANSVRDSFGNTLVSGTSATATVTRDTVAPTVTEVTVVDATTIDVTYSEEVQNATVATNYTLTAPNGNPVAVNNVVRRGTTNTYRLTVGSMAAGGNYTLSINNNITDTSVSANRLAPYTTTLTVGDLQAPTVNGVTINTARDRIYIEYSEPMATTGVNSALDVNNYRTATAVAGDQTALPAGTTITQNGNVVTIALPSALAANQTTLVIGQVADAAGNKIAALQTERVMAITDNFTTTIDQVRVTDRDTVTFRVGRHLRAVNASQIVVDQAVDATAQSASFVNNADGTATVTAKFAADSFATDLNGIDNLDLGAGALTDINNLTSAAMANQALATDADRVAPALASIAAWNNRSTRTQDTDNDGQIDRIQVAFSEDLYVPSVHESDFTVNGYTVTGVAVENVEANHGVAGAGSVVTLTLQEKATPDTGVTPDVTLVGSVQDDSAQRNQLGAQSAVTSFDGAAPLMVSAVATNATTLVINFTENISVGAGAVAADVAGQFAVDHDDAAATARVGATGYSINGNQLTLTLPAGTFTAGQDIGDILYTEHATAANRITDGNQTLATGATLADANTTTGF